MRTTILLLLLASACSSRPLPTRPAADYSAEAPEECVFHASVCFRKQTACTSGSGKLVCAVCRGTYADTCIYPPGIACVSDCAQCAEPDCQE